MPIDVEHWLSMHIGMEKLALRNTRCLVAGLQRRLMAAKNLKKRKKFRVCFLRLFVFFAAINVYFDIDAD